MKTVITGGSGFVGKNLREYLKSSHEVEVKSIRFVPNQHFDFKGNAIIHLAGKAHDLKNVAKPSDYYEANFELTKQVFDSFLKSDATVFIFLSSVKAAADQIKEMLTEDVVPNPKTHYGISKKQAEEYLLSKELPADKRLYILRPCMIHGPGNKGNLNLLYNFVLKNIPWPLGAFDNLRSFLSVENICFVINELLENKEIPNGIYHIADDDSLSTNELIQRIGMNLGKKTTIWKVSPWGIKTVARIGDYLSLPLNSERLNKLTENYVVSNSKIKKALKKELPVTTQEGLDITIKSFKKYN
ncbi:NAD-dependent epimerase/dehydratase family protein [Flavobacterium nitrogenifigens]|uniref:Nucleoside-diphosphate-sugar epimerase n=1 Tax=Flavobacterium nitrogenifigens TaxID=1617283 RepID=A0A521EDK4_9FLAO|nr:NAD-dependent epimerase/dehydratase family protein [Flavobacterium nitrogenifigens]KAF2325926.1 NAD-dependent epimerase/dehydratase family protein [Flavobacterium nitrogenifigens]SMO81998.1 Nucleoside-diphosphate-sugar epimerase [Flavobacterium nitrogenifigens]